MSLACLEQINVAGPKHLSCPSIVGLTAVCAAGDNQANGGHGSLFSSPMAAGIIGRQQTLSSQLADSNAQEAQAAASLAALMISLYPNLIPETSALDSLSQ